MISVEGWHKEAIRWGLGPHSNVGGMRAEMVIVHLDIEGYILECDLNNFDELNLNDSS